MTFLEIQTEILDRLNLTSSTDSTRIGRAINRLYKEVTSSIGLQLSRRETASVSASIGVSTITVTNCENIIAVYNRAVTPYKVLDEVSIDELRETQPYSASDVPTKWAINSITSDTHVIEINVIPQTAFSLYVEKMAVEATLSGSDEPSFPESYHDILVYGVLIDEYDKLEKPGLSTKAERRYEKRLSELRLWIALGGPYKDLYQGKMKDSAARASGGGSGSSSVNGALSYTQTGLITFDRDPLAPFAVTASSAVVTNLDADKVDGYEASALAVLAENETVSGNWTFSGTTTFSGSVVLGSVDGFTMTGSLLFSADNTHDIGAAGATRPRDFYLGRNALIGGTLGVTGTATLSAASALILDNASGILTFSGITAPEILFSAASAILSSNSDVLVNIDKDNNGSASFLVRANGTASNVFAVTEAGLSFINDSANANMTTGLTINQGAADNEILALKSSDVAHGMTTDMETDTFATFAKFAAADGGLRIRGYNDDIIGVEILGAGVNNSGAVPSTTAVAPVMVSGAYKAGGATASEQPANNFIFAIRNLATTRFLFDADGDSHQDVGTAWTNFDHIDDLKALDAVALALRPEDDLRLSFVNSLEEARDYIEAIPGKKIVQFNEDGHHFANMSRITMLHHGAIRFLARQNQALLAELAEVKQKLLTD